MEVNILSKNYDDPICDGVFKGVFKMKVTCGECIFANGVAVHFVCKQSIKTGNAIVVIDDGEHRIRAIKEGKFMFYATAPDGRKVYARTPYHAALHVYSARNDLNEVTHYLKDEVMK